MNRKPVRRGVTSQQAQTWLYIEPHGLVMTGTADGLNVVTSLWRTSGGAVGLDVVPVVGECCAPLALRPDALGLAFAGDRLARAVTFQGSKALEPCFEIAA